MMVDHDVRELVYIAGAISANNVIEYYKNRREMIEAGYEVILIGASPYIPVMYDDIFLLDRYRQIGYKEIWDTNVAWMKKARVVWKISDSPGADREEQLAIILGIPVVRTLVELCEVLGFTTESTKRVPAWGVREVSQGTQQS